MSRTFIENLPNEIFYEIFDYFDSYELYRSFSNLNHRFQQLINSSSLLLKIKIDCLQTKETFTKNYQQIIHLIKNRIFSIYVWSSEYTYQIISSFNFDSSFTCLESIAFSVAEPNLLTILIPKLTCLPRLFSLTIDSESYQKDLGDIYQLIFNLPKIKYIKFTAIESNDFYITVSLPTATDEQISSVEHLIIDHECDLEDIFKIISYTPQLRHLKLSNPINKNKRIEDIKPMILSNLIHLSIYTDRISFNEFKIFINKLNSKLIFLLLNTLNKDINYLDANQWKEFILNNLPQLDQFYFKYSAYFQDYYGIAIYLGKRDQFISSFWLQRQWILKTEIEFNNLVYSIRPYKKEWYEYDTQDKLSKSIQLIINNPYPERWPESIFVNHALTVTQISISKLNEILHLLPEINSLKISCLRVLQAGCLSKEEREFASYLSTKAQIRKIYFGNIAAIEELFMLTLICSRINHLQINCIDYMHAELLARIILSEIQIEPNHSLRLLCFSVPSADNHMVKKLENMIAVLDIFVDFMIKLSFHIPKNDFFLSFSIDSSFYRLQSLVIDQIPSTILLSILANLSSLPCLASLTMNIQYALRDLTELYRLIFTLPKLKYIKCSANEDFTSISLPIAHNGQFSPIKHLVINHECSMDTLCTLISYTSQLSHLSYLTYDNFETFYTEIQHVIQKFLRIINDSDSDDYLDSDRWEELIVNYLPKLETFYLKCSQDIDPESDSLSDFEPTAQFNSLFWNERKWVLEIEMISCEYIYSVRSYKERWYDVDHFNEISNSTRLKFTTPPHYNDYVMVLNLIIGDVLAITQIYHLEISEKNISSVILMRIILEFSALKTLKISSLELSELFIKDKNLRSISKNNKITKVYLEQMSKVKQEIPFDQRIYE